MHGDTDDEKGEVERVRARVDGSTSGLRVEGEVSSES